MEAQAEAPTAARRAGGRRGGAGRAGGQPRGRGHTATLRTASGYSAPQGGATTLSSLLRAHYFVNVGGSQVFFADTNGNSILEPSEAQVAPPALSQFSTKDGETGRPEKALAVKDVYLSREPDGTLVQRYDRAFEHEFRVVELSRQSITAYGSSGDTRRVDDTSGGASPAAEDSDLPYRLLISRV